MTKICSSVITAMFLIFNVFCAGDSQARVCFATDPDCGAGGNFGDMSGLEQYDTACKENGYNRESCLSGEIKYNCPYKSSWLKCCGKQFHYEGCVYPLEVDKSQVGEVINGETIYGKCGTRYACKCPDEYGVESSYAETNNCRPGGGYCMLNDGTTDTIKYKTCTCDKDIYTDTSSCKNNQTETSSCTDDAGVTYKKCYCDRSEGKYPHTSCTYGKVIGSKTCIDSSSGREYYHVCRTAEEACKDEGFKFSDCSGQRNCQTENKVYYKNSSGKWVYEYLVSSNCVAGQMCPYPTNPSLYKCVFDKASWCTKNNYAQSSSVKLSENSTCTTPDGIQGRVVNCPANDDYSLFYYRCKITCDQRVLKESSVGGLSAESLGKTGHGIGGRFGEVNDINGTAKPNAYWYYLANPKNGFRKGYHLFLRGDARLPVDGLSYNANNRNEDNTIRADANSNNPVYASINGISALYKLDPVTYADCADEYDDMSENPTLTVPLNGKYANNYMFSRDFHNINITLSRYKDDGKTFVDWGGKTFNVVRQGHLGSAGNPGPSYATTYIWSNIKMSVDAPSNSSGVGNSDFGDGVNSGMIYLKDRAIIDLYRAVKLRFTGKILFNLPIMTFMNQSIVNPEKSSTSTNDENEKIAASWVDLAFRTQEYAIIEFKDAEVSGSGYSLNGTGSSGDYLFESSGYPDFDSDCDSGNDWNKDGILNIDNSNVSATNHYGCLYLNMKNGSTYNVVRFYSRASDINYGKSGSNMNFINQGGQYCRAAAILGNSTFNIKSKHGVTDIRKYLYISGGSKVVSNNPVRLMNGPYSTVCIGDTSSSLIVNVNAGYSSFGKGSHTYDASYSSDYDTNASSYYVGTMSNVSSDKLVMYSRGDGACIPYELNNDPSSSYSNVTKNKMNPWRNLCTGSTNSSGYNNKTASTNFDNKMPDEVSMRTPGSFSVKVGSSYTTTINSWYPRRKTKYSIRRCDSDKTYGTTESATLNMCGTTTSDSGTEPQYTDSGFDTYISGYNSGKCLNRKFLCSGCAYCSAGVGYSDWSDADGGLGTDSVAW